LVSQIKDRVVADIKAKKIEKTTENKLFALIQEAQDAVQQNDLVKLQDKLEKINAYRNSLFFQKKKKQWRT